MSYTGTLTPFPADSEQSSLVKIAASAGADVSGGEPPYTLWRKIVLALGGAVTGAENEHTLIVKAATLWGADVHQGMFDQTILHKALLALGGSVSGRESIQRALYEIDLAGGGVPPVDPFADVLFRYFAGGSTAAATFTRPSLATYMDDEQMVAYAPQNYIGYSSQFDSAHFTGLGATVTSNAALAPDGTNTAAKIVEDLTNGEHVAYQAVSHTPVNGQLYTWSCYIKAAGWTSANLRAQDGAGIGYAQFNLANGTLGPADIGLTSAIENVGNGWYRCSVTKAITGGAYWVVGIQRGINDGAWLGTATTNGLFVWGPQYEKNRKPTTYLPTTTARLDGIRDSHYVYDTPSETYVRTTLLEGQRTNLFLHSQDFTMQSGSGNGVASPVVTGNFGAAPDGSMTASRIQIPAVTTAGNWSNLAQGINVGGVSSTFSVWLKGSAGGEVVSLFETQDGVTYLSHRCVLTSQWVRYYMTGVPSNGGCAWGIGNDLRDTAQAATATADFLAWGAQCEVGSFASSYIPTVAATVTRSADALRFPIDFNPQALTVYGRGIDAGTGHGDGYPGLLDLGTVGVRVFALGTYRVLDIVGTNASTINAAISAGDGYEFRGAIEAGAGINEFSALLNDSINRGTENSGFPGAPIALAAFPEQKLTLNLVSGGTSGFFAFQDVLIAKGVKDLAYFRDLIDIAP